MHPPSPGWVLEAAPGGCGISPTYFPFLSFLSLLSSLVLLIAPVLERTVKPRTRDDMSPATTPTALLWTLPLVLVHAASKFSFPSAARGLLSFAVPSVLSPSPAKPVSLRPIDPQIAAQRASTDCLDGLRGVAAFAVMIFHYSSFAYPNIRTAYGYNGNTNLLKLPFVKIWYSGGFMVFLFFVISGYVLSARAVRLMLRRDRDRILPVLSSMTFRRVVRLGLPSLVMSFISFLCQRAQLLDKPWPHYVPGLWGDIRFYFENLRDLFTFYNWNQFHIYYLPPLWTIAVEFRCSMILFLLLLGIARCRTGPRLLIEALVFVDTMLHDRWDLGCFVLGLLAAEIHVGTQEAASQRSKEEGLLHNADATDSSFQYDDGRNWNATNQRRRRILKKLGLWACFIAGMYLGSVPTEHTCETPGYATLCKLTWHGEKWRYIALPGSFLIIVGILYLPILQRPLVAPAARYLGRVSYALYLVHELVNMLIGKGIRNAGWALLGKTGVMYHFGYVFGLVFYVSLSLWLADMFMRAVDMPSTNLARWLEEKCVDKS
ncbi:hypothetical protein V501_03131 [Pseudogymnoascus sp. VKM F-4519 (FW-2642)]|nr:hypothetical protein V501_03131 [Pseudogymnoascus sp. VKM F-4519 (FW-2642)]